MAYKAQILNPAAGGTGVANNDASTITISGAFASTFTMTGVTGVTFPTSGTLATTSQLPSLPLSPANGGTGIANNASSTLTISGAFGTTLTVTGTTAVTLPTSGTLLSQTTGTWTPVVNINAATTGITYSTQEGRYVQIGSIVFIFARITLSSKGALTGNVTITGLPVAASTVSGDNVMFVQYQSALSLTASYTNCVMTISNGATTGTLFETGSGQSIANVTNTLLANTTDLVINGFYHV